MDQGQTLKQKIKEAQAYLTEKVEFPVKLGIILGTGLGGLVNDVEMETEVHYSDIPHFPVSTVESHAGRFIFGELGGKRVVVMQGRFHYYEGYHMHEITFPVRVMKEMGVTHLLISNAAGGLNPLYHKGDIMLMDDHINLLGDNPLIGINDPDFGPRFPDMSEPYSKKLMDVAENAAREKGFSVHRGVYAAMSGPSLETRAEYRFLRRIGADVIGMSSIPENIVAVQCGMEVFGITVVTDLCFPDALKPATLEDIIAAADEAEPKLTVVMKGVVEGIQLS